ncbi:Hypothetical Protein FCC1311_091022 [Hondaea fermentalgiana]|uniref:Uncharacterized protein n=1 Tax=Hondaea fermentalgiana TaxID=2315210 RepID=A0A2R5GPT5_9STRA|nr:Hypothetical Protein FCC1311_091022 [Hondaea fermentalgiana]|eukprot:GBG32877.1 Hypothetical Protein FCC1311_091022 [Hondaea fermentalgiana]
MAEARQAHGARADAARDAPKERQHGGAVIDFDEYDAAEDGLATARSTLANFDDFFDGDAEAHIGRHALSVDLIRSKIPASVLRTFEPDSVTLATLEARRGSEESREEGDNEHNSSGASARPAAGSGAGATGARGVSGSRSSGAAVSRSISAQQSSAGSEGDGSTCSGILNALVRGLARALTGDSMVTAPVLYKNANWLGRISVSPGPLQGNLVTKYRTYRVQGEVLAGGHVLPWKLGRVWRYSEIRRLLVDSLQVIVERYGLEEWFGHLFSKFPGKNWSGRNKPEIADFRAQAIETYIENLLKACNKAMRDYELKCKKKSGRRRRMESGEGENFGTTAAASSSRASDGASAFGTSDIFTPRDILAIEFGGEFRFPGEGPPLTGLERLAKGLQEVTDLLVGHLLHVNGQLRSDVTKLSDEMGALITSTPLDHVNVTKEFKITPQQAL